MQTLHSRCLLNREEPLASSYQLFGWSNRTAAAITHSITGGYFRCLGIVVSYNLIDHLASYQNVFFLLYWCNPLIVLSYITVMIYLILQISDTYQWPFHDGRQLSPCYQPSISYQHTQQSINITDVTTLRSAVT